ncbi:MAG: hypothetical protein AAF533_30025 [Acidobacteriota bacterium]
MPEVTPEQLEAGEKFVQWVERLGAGTVLAYVLTFAAITIVFRWFAAWLKGREVHLALQAKDDEIERMAAELRDYRAALFMDKLNWTQAQVDRIIYQNEVVAEGQASPPEPQKPRSGQARRPGRSQRNGKNGRTAKAK